MAVGDLNWCRGVMEVTKSYLYDENSKWVAEELLGDMEPLERYIKQRIVKQEAQDLVIQKMKEGKSTLGFI